jgi:acid phosphatase type 7
VVTKPKPTTLAPLLVTASVLAVCWARASTASAAPLVAAAGDIACDPRSPYFNGGVGTRSRCRQLDTSRLLGDANAIVTLGDTQYEHSSLSNLRRSFDRSWGRSKSRIRPAIGNHEYGTGVECGPTRCPTNRGASGYFDYFGARAGPRGALTTPTTSATGT